jgi:hypothetical protein
MQQALRVGGLVLLAGTLMHASASARGSAPIVSMSVTLPDGRTEELTAPESGLATVRLQDGTEYGFRPTIHDSQPWNRIIVTVFRQPTATSPTEILGEVELKNGGPAVESQTKPRFKIAVPKVSPPPAPAQSSR